MSLNMCLSTGLPGQLLQTRDLQSGGLLHQLPRMHLCPHIKPSAGSSSLIVMCSVLSVHQAGLKAAACQPDDVKCLSSVQDHLRLCQYELQQCTNPGCTTVLQRKDLQEHLTNTCPHRQEPCPHCSQLLQLSLYQVQSIQTSEDMLAPTA